MDLFAHPGLDVDAAHLYAAVLAQPGRPQHAYRESTGLDDAAFATALATLERLGLVDVSPEGVELGAPTSTLERAMAAEEADLSTREEGLARLRNAVADYHHAHGGEVESLAGEDVIDLVETIDRLARSTAGDVRVAHPGIPHTDPSAHAGLMEAVTSGRTIRGLYESDSAHVRSLELSHWAAVGEEQRLVRAIPTQFMVFGFQAVIVATQWGRSGSYTVISDAPVVQAYVTLFDALWASGTSADTSIETDSDRLVDLLEEGLDDEEIAHEMGMTQRAVRKRVQALMHECGVSTRFQLAVALNERGMLNVKDREDGPAGS